MKKIFAALCALLLVPTMASANSDLVSIAELHRQTVERGRWTKTYDTPNGELNVDTETGYLRNQIAFSSFSFSEWRIMFNISLTIRISS